MSTQTTTNVQHGQIWGILMIGGGGPRDDRGLSIHDWVRNFGYREYFARAAKAVNQFQSGRALGGVVVKNVYGNFADRAMLVDDRDRLLPLVSTRAAVEDEICAGLDHFRKATGIAPWIYPGGLNSGFWRSLSADQLRDRLRHYLRPFAGYNIAFDAVDQDVALRAADIVEEDGADAGYEPLDRFDGNWWSSVRRCFVTSRHLAEIEAGRTFEDAAHKIPIQWAPIDQMCGPRTLLVEQRVEPTLDEVHARLAQGWDVALGCLSGKWRPGNSAKALTVNEIVAEVPA